MNRTVAPLPSSTVKPRLLSTSACPPGRQVGGATQGSSMLHRIPSFATQ